MFNTFNKLHYIKILYFLYWVLQTCNFVSVVADEVDRVVMQKPAIAAKKPGLASALKRPAAGIRITSASSSGNTI